VPADDRERIANAIAMHHSPGVGLESGAEAYLLSAGAAVEVFGLRSSLSIGLRPFVVDVTARRF
jgi:hypothetical protein